MSSTSLTSILEKLTPDLKNKVGDVLLGDEELLAKLQGANTDDLEADTPWERELVQLLRRWTGTSTDPSAKQLAQFKSDLDKLKKEFPTIVQPPQGKLAFRGTAIRTKSLIPAIQGQRGWKTAKVGGESYVVFPKLPYSPNRPAQSWTVDKHTARSFGSAKKGAGAGGYTALPVMYTAKVDSSFIMAPKALNVIYTGDIHGGEDEVIRVAGKGVFSGLILVCRLFDAGLVHLLPGTEDVFQKHLAALNNTLQKTLGKTVSSWSRALASKDPEGAYHVSHYYEKAVRAALKTSW